MICIYLVAMYRGFSTSKLTNLSALVQNPFKRFEMIKLVLTQRLESVKCIPYPRGRH
ncbi:hypothetical protein [Vibrio gallaecicus]|uniref:hypothetical protein n=1 Tax=Vibrio gallaecicus TaxID=552386 RepID=UPI0025B2F80C|nr:hypothetical protein [Vibrio gallaecicus]MDN3613707.1 hypothetical protein [Vibrio gallaecicus]